MADAAPGSSGGLAPVAVVWCRQVDNEAESPGYTTIPEEFPGRRETLEAIRIIGNLTVNVADTHDYWDPDPAQPLSYYPNLFLYPAANGRYTCVGRMFLSTEDRPRLGMKTLVFTTADLVASGEFGPAVLRAHATMGGRSVPARVSAEPDGAVYQAVGEGFLFHRGTTEPVVVVAAEQWEAAAQVVLDLVRLLPTALVLLGAFLVFPYFLPEAKVNMHEFTEQIPLALAVMRVPRGEAQGDRHSKRIQSWDSSPVAVRDLTKPPASKSKETLPLVLQYARDHLEPKVMEVAQRVDLVEGNRTRAELHDAERQAGRDRRKEMWRIGTAMETAALLLTRPKGRSVPMSGEAAKRANEYVQAQPSILISRSSARTLEPLPVAPSANPAEVSLGQHPPWLQRPTEIELPPPGPVAVPVSVSDDPSAHASAPTDPPRTAPSLPSPPSPAPPAPSDAEVEARLKRLVDQRVEEAARAKPAPIDPAQLEARVTAAFDARLREVSEQSARALLSLQSDVGSRIAVVESRPIVDVGEVTSEAERRVRAQLEPMLSAVSEKMKATVQATGEAWAGRLRDELQRAAAEMKAAAARGEEELRAALAAQIDLELRETKEQGTALREEIEARVRTVLNERAAELDARRTRETRDLEQRLGLLIDGRTKDLEGRLMAVVSDQKQKITSVFDERIGAAERRLGVEREARVSEVSESQTQALAGLQVRLQAYVEQKVRENQEREREKYVELLARLKSELEQLVAKSIDSNLFDTAVRDRVLQVLDSTRSDQGKLTAAAVAEAQLQARREQEENLLRVEHVEMKLEQREADLLRVERAIRTDVDDLDRRLQVMSDRMLPLVRKTWLKVGELEKGVPVADETDARMKDLRREVLRELRRVEGELLEQTGELRDRLEGTIAHQGRIWLNLLKQLSAESEQTSGELLSGPRVARRPPRASANGVNDDFLGSDLGTPVAYSPFSGDPPNPMSPAAQEPAVDEREARRRRRS